MKNVFLIVILCILLSGCSVLGKTKTQNRIVKKVEKTEKVKDSTSIVENNKAIRDKAVINIPESTTGDKDFDKRVNNAVSNILKSINFQKSSGDNGYKLYYDAQLRQLKAQIDIAATQNKEVNSNNKEKEQTNTFEQLEEYIKKIVLPWWIWPILLFLFRKQVISVLGLFYPPIKGVKTLKDLFTPPNSEDKE